MTFVLFLLGLAVFFWTGSRFSISVSSSMLIGVMSFLKRAVPQAGMMFAFSKMTQSSLMSSLK